MKTEEHTFRSKGTRWPFSQKKVNAVSLHSGRWSSISSLLLVRCSLYSAPKGEQGENATTSSSALWAPSNIWRFGLSSVYWSQLSHFFLVSTTFLLRLQVDFFLGCQNNLVCIAIQSGRRQHFVDKSIILRGCILIWNVCIILFSIFIQFHLFWGILQI